MKTIDELLVELKKDADSVHQRLTYYQDLCQDQQNAITDLTAAALKAVKEAKRYGFEQCTEHTQSRCDPDGNERYFYVKRANCPGCLKEMGFNTENS